MSQHFLLSAKARSLSLATVARMSDEEAYEAFKCIRWSDTKGEPFCPRCACAALYTYKTRRLWKCKGCSHQFSVTSGTIFASRKLPVRDYLLAIAIFVNGAKGLPLNLLLSIGLIISFIGTLFPALVDICEDFLSVLDIVEATTARL